MDRVAFVIGASRSGTTVLAESLSKHPDVHATEELHFYNLLAPLSKGVENADTRLASQLLLIEDEGRFFEIKNGAAQHFSIAQPDFLPRTGEAVFPAFLNWLARREQAKVVVEHTPMNLYYRDQIRRDFEKPVFFLMQRDPRAILASQKNRWKVGQNGERDIPAADIARVRWSGHPLLQLMLLRSTVRAIATAAQEDDVVSVVYEELVQDPVTVLSRLSGRLGIEYDPAMAAVSDRGSSHSSEAGRIGFDPSRLQGWSETLSGTEIWLIEKLFANSLRQPSTGARPRIGELVRLFATMPLAVVMAGYYSSKSYGNLLDAVRKRFF